MSQNTAIILWRFDEAPPEYQVLSQNGGDEDWLAFIPDCFHNEYIGFLEEGTTFGCCTVEYHKVSGGEIRIGCHA